MIDAKLTKWLRRKQLALELHPPGSHGYAGRARHWMCTLRDVEPYVVGARRRTTRVWWGRTAKEAVEHSIAKWSDS